MRLTAAIYGIAGLLLASCSNEPNQGAPFTKQQIMELRNGLERGITYRQVKEILGRDADTVWRYNSNSGTIPITVREFHDRYGRSVVVHLNSDDIVVTGSHDVRSFSP